MKKTFIIVAVIAAIVVLSFGGYEWGRNHGWWGETNELRALKAEVMADTGLLGLTLKSSDENNGKGIAAKDTTPSVERIFLVNREDIDKVKMSIISRAEADGWARDDNLSDESGWVGRKKSSRGFDLALLLDIREDTIRLSVVTQ